MTQDEIIKLAQEAGFTPNGSLTVLPMSDYANHGICYQLERFADLIIAHEREKYVGRLADSIAWTAKSEREACAKICDEYSELSIKIWGASNSDYEAGQENASRNCATSIRARNKK